MGLISCLILDFEQVFSVCIFYMFVVVVFNWSLAC